jgi:hypothetical protein
MGKLKTQSLVDSVLGAAVDVAHAKSGYYFNIIDQSGSGGDAQFGAYAFPAVTTGVSQTGTRVFGITQVGVMRGGTTLTIPALTTDIDALGVLGN